MEEPEHHVLVSASAVAWPFSPVRPPGAWGERMRTRITVAAVGISLLLLGLSYLVTTGRLQHQRDPMAESSEHPSVQGASSQVELDDPESAVAAVRSGSTVDEPAPMGGFHINNSVDAEGLKVSESQYLSGNLKSRVPIDASGAKHGEFLGWYENGSIWERGRFESDLKEGPWISFYSSGVTRGLVTYEHGKMIGTLLAWHDNGQIAMSKTLQDGRANGPCTLWWRNGRVQAMGNKEDSQASGTWTWWKEDGSLDAEKTGTYQNGKRVD